MRTSGWFWNKGAGWTCSVGLLGAMLAAPARAQPLSPLTLDAAVRLAQRNSLAVATSASKLKQAEDQVAQVYSGIVPQLSLSSSALSSDQIDQGGISPLAFGGLGGGGFGGGFGGLGFGGLGGFGAAGLGGGSSIFSLVDTSVTLTQILFDGFQIQGALHVADATLRLDRLDLVSQRKKAGYDAADAYIQVLRDQALLKVAQDTMRQAQAHLDVARSREHAGVGTQFDILQAESQLASTQGQLRSAMNTLDLARLSLVNVLGAPLGDRPLQRDVVLPDIAFDPAHSLAAAIKNRPEFQTVQLTRRIDEANLALARVTNYPKAQAELEYSQMGLGTGRSLLALAGLSWTLIDGGKVAAKVQSSQEDVRQADQNLELTRRNLMTDIQGAVLARQDAKDRLAIALRGLSASQESYRMAQVRYNAGVGTGFELIDAQTMLVQARNSYVQADYDVQAAEVRLAQALGLDVGDIMQKKGS